MLKSVTIEVGQFILVVNPDGGVVSGTVAEIVPSPKFGICKVYLKTNEGKDVEIHIISK